jgi:hypothetical protein
LPKFRQTKTIDGREQKGNYEIEVKNGSSGKDREEQMVGPEND